MGIEHREMPFHDITPKRDENASKFGGRPPKNPTAEDIAFIENNPTLPIKILCEKLNISRNTLRRWRKEGAISLEQRPHGRPPRPVSDPSFMGTIVELHSQGLSPSVIAKKVGAGYTTVRRNLTQPVK